MELNFLSKLVCCHQYRSIRLRDPLLFIRTEGGALEELGRGRRSFGGLSEEIWGDRGSFRWGWRSLRGGGRRSFGGSEEFCGGRRNFGRSEEFLGGGPEGVLGGRRSVRGVGGVLGGSKEFWGRPQEFGGMVGGV